MMFQFMMDIPRKVVESVRSDPRRASLLAFLTIVMLLMWWKVMEGASSHPATASAGMMPGSSSAEASNNLPLEPAMSESARRLHEWLQAPLTPVSRNHFAINLDYFPQDGIRVAQSPRISAGEGFWDELAKSMALRADLKKEREVLMENLRLQAAQLHLQSTVMGTTPKAMINGKLVGEGDVVASFRVVKIEARGIIVEREGIKLEILFK